MGLGWRGSDSGSLMRFRYGLAGVHALRGWLGARLPALAQGVLRSRMAAAIFRLMSAGILRLTEEVYASSFRVTTKLAGRLVSRIARKNARYAFAMGNTPAIR